MALALALALALTLAFLHIRAAVLLPQSLGPMHTFCGPCTRVLATQALQLRARRFWQLNYWDSVSTVAGEVQV